MSRKLTEDEIRNLQYFWQEKGDLERLSGFNVLVPLLKEQAPIFWIAWTNYKSAIKHMDASCKNLPNEVIQGDEF